ncbi:MAG TPA: TetR/AcrR family transcriptional regulator [Gaiellaceae bacterium]|nr:TetR/AcrR family transcriptional regulator [Gaiellaceae bacterium]
MPKISAERKAERREQILAGARRCFAAHGYEGATVARLEAEIGLSRGAIFNYFPSKEDLFVELAVRDTARMSELFVSEGLEAVVREVAELDPDWLSVYLELYRRVRTDADFRQRIQDRQQAVRPANRARIEEGQRSGEFRDDLEPEQIGRFLNLVLNGLALQRAGGEELPPAELTLNLLADAIGGPALGRRGARTRRARA